MNIVFAIPKAESTAKYNAALTVSADQKLLDRISDKRVALILTALNSGPECATRKNPLTRRGFPWR
ncbi:hypothetical protein [Microbacterium sp. LBN7]|uniref:hypothetical protein n=1 Tax=Microbacterium sp. LBN7 TaxID=3129773 RepID=UPI0032452D9E